MCVFCFLKVAAVCVLLLFNFSISARVEFLNFDLFVQVAQLIVRITSLYFDWCACSIYFLIDYLQCWLGEKTYVREQCLIVARSQTIASFSFVKCFRLFRSGLHRENFWKLTKRGTVHVTKLVGSRRNGDALLVDTVVTMLVRRWNWAKIGRKAATCVQSAPELTFTVPNTWFGTVPALTTVVAAKFFNDPTFSRPTDMSVASLWWARNVKSSATTN